MAFVPAALGRVPANRQGKRGTPRGCCRPREAAPAREPSCERGWPWPSAAGRPDSGTDPHPDPHPCQAEAAGTLSVPGGTWQPPAGSGGGRLGGGGGGGGERRRRPAGPGPAQPSALPRPDTAPEAEMADEPQKKPYLSALVGHTNGLTKPASLAATATRSTGGGGGGATASSKKLVIKNFRGRYGAGRALCPGRCARPDLCLLRPRPLPAPCPRPGPAAVTRPAAVSGRGAAAAGLITLPAPCPCKGSRGHAWAPCAAPAAVGSGQKATLVSTLIKARRGWLPR